MRISSASTSGSMRRKVCLKCLACTWIDMQILSLNSCTAMCMIAGSVAKVETLKRALAQAKEEAKASKAAADKAAADLKSEQDARRQYEERVTEVEQELKDTAGKCESLEERNKTHAAELAKALQEAKEARTESRAAHEEIKQAKQIAAGKPFLLQSKFGDQRYALLNRLWSSPDVFADLPRSASGAAQYF